MDRGGGDDAAIFDEAELGGAATDIDVQYPLPQVVRYACRARAVRRERGFHVVAGRGANEFPASFRQYTGDGLGVLPAQRFPGEDHDTRIDVVGMDAGSVIGFVDDGGKLRLIDALLARVGG